MEIRQECLHCKQCSVSTDYFTCTGCHKNTSMDCADSVELMIDYHHPDSRTTSKYLPEKLSKEEYWFSKGIDRRLLVDKEKGDLFCKKCFTGAMERFLQEYEKTIGKKFPFVPYTDSLNPDYK